MKYFYCVFLIFLISGISVQAQNKFLGIPVVQNFSTDDYGAGTQNYAITQDKRGLIYVGNNFGLLEYDGNQWRKYRVANGTKIRSVVVDVTGKIFVGAQNEIGYFKPDKSGSYRYNSLNPLIASEYSNFEDIWNIHPYQDGYVFAGSEQLFFYSKDSIEVLPISGGVDFTFKLRNDLLTPFTSGLKILEDRNWRELPYSMYFRETRISGIIPFDQQDDLIATYDKGLFLVRGNKVTLWPTELDNEATANTITTIKRLNSGLLAIGTNTDGLFILNQDGEIVFHFTKDRGLLSRTILSIFEDSFGHIWLGMNNGIAKIEWDSPFSFLDEEMGLIGTGYTAYDNGSDLYLGTNNGLFLMSKGKPGGKNTLQQVDGIEGQIYTIQNIGGDILVGAHSGAYLLLDTRVELIYDKTGWWIFKGTSKPNVILGGTYDGIVLLKKIKGKWSVSKTFEATSESSRVMEFDKNGRLWMSHGYKGIFSFKFSDDFEEIVESRYYDQNDGLPSNILNNVFKISGEVIFTTEHGIYIYNSLADKFEPNDKFTDIFGPDIQLREMVEDSHGNVYFMTTTTSGILNRDNWDNYQIRTNVFNKIQNLYNDDLEEITIFDQGDILYAAKEGFIHFRTDDAIRLDRQPTLLFRRITLTNNDSLLFDGNFNEDGLVLTQQPPSQIPKFSYENNSIAFTFSAVDFDQEPCQYRYKLQSFDENWSDWQHRTEKEYTNLPEGDYQFMVQTREVYGNVSDVVVYEFSIAPPWYRASYALISYVLLAIGIIVLSVLLTRKKHVKEKRLLINHQEQELNQRDSELQEFSRKSREEIERLKHEKLKSEISHKRKELATSTMNLMNKSDFINSIKQHLSEIIKNGSESDVSRELRRIIKEIDKNIDGSENWDQFELHFDEVHGGFIMKIKRDHPTITPQEIKLCAYLRMNMSTKEIANLLRISVRGVEIARYRLRKKLQLDKDENLVEFMLNYGSVPA